MGDKFLNVAGFRQMCGRAGRMGLDAKVRLLLSFCFSTCFLTVLGICALWDTQTLR